MPLFEEINQPANQNANQSNRTNQNPENQTPNNPTQKPQSSGLLTIIGQLLPLAPFAFEQFTGQKVPQMTGTIAEMQMALIGIQNNLATIANNQQSLNQRLINLETNANQHLTNLTQQFQSFRLTHTKERKEIDFNRPSENQTDQNY